MDWSIQEPRLRNNNLQGRVAYKVVWHRRCCGFDLHCQEWSLLDIVCTWKVRYSFTVQRSSTFLSCWPLIMLTKCCVAWTSWKFAQVIPRNALWENHKNAAGCLGLKEHGKTQSLTYNYHVCVLLCGCACYIYILAIYIIMYIIMLCWHLQSIMHIM